MCHSFGSVRGYVRKPLRREEIWVLTRTNLVLPGVGVLMGRMFAQPVPQLPLPEAGPAPTAAITA